MTKKNVKVVTLAEAEEVLNAHREAEQRDKNAKLLAYVGRFFKYRNCYSCPENDADYWWLYAAPREVEDWGAVKGLTFQRDKDDKIEVDAHGRISLYPDHLGGWIEITAAEFWKAAADIRQRADMALRRRRVGPSQERKGHPVGGRRG